MIEYRVADNFFKKNNHIVKEDFVVCRIKKKNVYHHVMDAEDGDAVGIIDPMLLLEPNHNNGYSTPNKIKLRFVRLQLRNTMFKIVV